MSNYVLIRIEALQKELEELRQVVIHQERQTKQTTQLKGIWRGVKFSDDDLLAARKSIFKDIYDQ